MGRKMDKGISLRFLVSDPQMVLHQRNNNEALPLGEES
jgi:hypothetical protein